MDNAVSNIIEDACKKSLLYEQIKTLMNMQKGELQILMFYATEKSNLVCS